MGSTTAALSQVTSLATNTAAGAWHTMGDFLIILVIALFFFGFAWYVNTGPFVAIMLSYYGAYAIYIAFPYAKYLPQAPALTALLAHVGLYAALCFAFYVVLRRLVVSDFLYIGNIGLLILALLAASFLIALAYHVFPVAAVYQFSPAMDMLFAAKEYFFWWFIAPAIGLFFLAR